MSNVLSEKLFNYSPKTSINSKTYCIILLYFSDKKHRVYFYKNIPSHFISESHYKHSCNCCSLVSISVRDDFKWLNLKSSSRGLYCSFYLRKLKEPFPLSLLMSENRAYESECADVLTSLSDQPGTILKIILTERRGFQPPIRLKLRTPWKEQLVGQLQDVLLKGRGWRCLKIQYSVLIRRRTTAIEEIFDKFKSMVLVRANQKQSAGRGLRPARANWDPSDFQKLQSSLRFNRSFNLSSVTNDQNLSIPIAKHLGKRNSRATMYVNLHLAAEKIISFIAYSVFPNLGKNSIWQSKAAEQPRTGRILWTRSFKFSTVRTKKVPYIMKSEENHDKLGELASYNPSSSIVLYKDDEVDSILRGHLSHWYHAAPKKSDKSYLWTKFKALSLRNAQVITDAMRPKVELPEDNNVLPAFSEQLHETEHNKRDLKDFLFLTRAEHLRRVIQRHQIATSSWTLTVLAVP